ncbi:MAG: hypothetical protein K9M36_02590 [Candidatus Pacebacteria bacterium]|nr:hypothetical protein [Candidatus Paceibacterota bacterium]
MIVVQNQTDNRYKKLFTINRNYWATETSFRESNIFISEKGYKRILKRNIKKLSFGTLREYYPNTCPLYYNYISAMHNPAIVGGENFAAELIIKSLIKNTTLTKKEEKLNSLIANKLGQSKHNEKDDNDLMKLLREANVRMLSKKRGAIRKNDENYFNDIKSLALSLLYCLQRKRNVTFVTSDSDFLNLVFDLFSTVIQESTFNVKIIPLLDDDKKQGLMNKKRYTFFLDSFEFIEYMEKYMADIFADNWKKDFLIFKIKYWDILTQKYHTLEFRFDDTMRQIFLNSHGTRFCPCAKNNENSNWIRYMYWWPPNSIHNEQVLKVVVEAKNGIIKEDTRITDTNHTEYCRYPQEDNKGNLNFFSNFF